MSESLQQERYQQTYYDSLDSEQQNHLRSLARKSFKS